MLGRYLKARAKRRSGSALRALLEMSPPQVEVRRNGVQTMIDIARLQVGEEFLVRPGDRITTDGVIISGHTAMNTAMISGEAVPVEVGPGDLIIGGCVNTHGRLVVRVTRVGADTQLAQIARLVTNARAGKA